MTILSTLGGAQEARNLEFDAASIGHVEMRVPYIGASFYVDGHPKLPGEAQLIANDLIHTLQYTDTDLGVMQVIRASTDNIHDLAVVLRGEAATGTRTLVDDGETPANWTTSDATLVDVGPGTVQPYAGSKALELEIASNTPLGGYIERVLPSPMDISSFNNFEFYIKSDDVIEVNLAIRDSSGNEATYNYTSDGLSTWALFDLPIASFTDVSLVDLTDVSALRVYAITGVKNKSISFDEVYLEGEENQVIEACVELYDFGATPPTSLADGTRITLDEGQTMACRTLGSVKKIYNFHVHAGSHNPANALTVGNYYGVYLLKPVNGNIELWGSAQQVYQSGDCSVVASDGSFTNQSASAGFMVYTITPALLTEFEIKTSEDADETYVYVMYINANFTLDTFIATLEFMQGERSLRVQFDTDKEAERLVCDTSKFLYFYVQHAEDSVSTHFDATVRYNYKKVEVYG